MREPVPAERRAAAPGAERLLLGFLAAVGLLLAGGGFLVQAPGALLAGWWQILKAPSMLLSDGMAIGGPGAALFNAGVMTLLSCLLLRVLKSPVNGPAVAAVGIVSGFALFGKNPLNAAPLVAGLLSYMRWKGISLSSAAVPALFATTLGPLSSAVATGAGLPQWAGIPLGAALGFVAGAFLVPVSRVTLGLHRGYTVYNIGFAAGLVGTLMVSTLRVLGMDLSATRLVDTAGGGLPFAVGFAALFLATALLGWILHGRSAKGYAALLKESGQLTCDMVKHHGAGLTLVNMGLCGLMALAVPLATGAPMNGPVLGTVLTVYGFAAFGKHPANCLPVMAGALLATYVGGYALSDTGAIIVVVFATNLAPISGGYGPAAGVLAGVLHVALAHNVGVLHAGVNLYNNGFAGGFVAALLPPLMEEWRLLRGGRRVG